MSNYDYAQGFRDGILEFKKIQVLTLCKEFMCELESLAIDPTMEAELKGEAVFHLTNLGILEEAPELTDEDEENV